RDSTSSNRRGVSRPRFERVTAMTSSTCAWASTPGRCCWGGGVDADATIRGIAVNIAARMEQAAPIGHLRVSHTTYRHVRGLFDVSEKPPILVKGIADPVRSYVVLRARPRTFDVTRRGVDGAEAPLIGREAELARLMQTFEAVVERRTLGLVTL